MLEPRPTEMTLTTMLDQEVWCLGPLGVWSKVEDLNESQRAARASGLLRDPVLTVRRYVEGLPTEAVQERFGELTVLLADRRAASVWLRRTALLKALEE